MATYAARRVRFTYADYLLLPEEQRRELIDGEFRMVPAPTPDHQDVSQRLEYEFIRRLQMAGIGKVFHAPIDVVLSDEDVVQPDILFIAQERLGIIQKTHIRGAPDLVIEILSPKTSERDRKVKRKLYEKYGVGEYWIVDPDGRSVEVLVSGTRGFRTVGVFRPPSVVTSTTFPRLKIRLKGIFE